LQASILSHSTCLDALTAHLKAQSSHAARCAIGPITNRAVSRSGGILHSVDGHEPITIASRFT